MRLGNNSWQFFSSATDTRHSRLFTETFDYQYELYVARQTKTDKLQAMLRKSNGVFKSYMGYIDHISYFTVYLANAYVLYNLVYCTSICNAFNGDWIKLPFHLRHEWVTTSDRKERIYLFIRAILLIKRASDG